MIPTSCLGCIPHICGTSSLCLCVQVWTCKAGGLQTLKQPKPRGTARVIFFIDASSNKHQSTIRKSRTCNTSPKKKIIPQIMWENPKPWILGFSTHVWSIFTEDAAKPVGVHPQCSHLDLVPKPSFSRALEIMVNGFGKSSPNGLP